MLAYRMQLRDSGTINTWEAACVPVLAGWRLGSEGIGVFHEARIAPLIQPAARAHQNQL